MTDIVHMTSAHSVADTRIFVKECCSLVRAGYDTVLVAPNDVDEVQNGVQIRAMRYKYEGRLSRMTKGVYRVYQIALQEDADLYHFHDPELLPVGVWLRARGKRVVYDVHEDLPRQILTKEWIASKARSALSSVSEMTEAVLARGCSGVVAATPKIAKRFPAEKTALVQNFPIADELITQSQADYDERPNRVIYIGGISRKRGAWNMVRALNELDPVLDGRLTIAGRFASDSARQVMSLDSWDMVDFKGWLDRKELRDELHGARAGLVVLHPTPSYVHSQPIKLFEYMAAGLPVIASDFPLWRDIIKEVDCGLLVDPLDPGAIGEAIEWVFSHPEEAEAMGERGREAVIKRFNWESELSNLLKMYERLL